jgi:hypothetical protein
MKYLILLLLLIVPVLAACGADSDPTIVLQPTETPTNTPYFIVVTATPEQLTTETVIPTDIPINTAIPTAIPPATSVPVAVVPTAGPQITQFSTNMISVDAIGLSLRNVIVPISWTVENRPGNSNLGFYQVMYSNTQYEIDMPRDFIEVPSVGTGLVVPFLPSGDATQIHLRMQLDRIGGGLNWDYADLYIPIINNPSAGQFVISNSDNCFDAPYPPDRNIAPNYYVRAEGTLAGIPLYTTSGIGGFPGGGIFNNSDVALVLDGPVCFSSLSSDVQSTFRQWYVQAQGGGRGWVYEYWEGVGDNQYVLHPMYAFDVYEQSACFDAPLPQSIGIEVGGQVEFTQLTEKVDNKFTDVSESKGYFYAGDVAEVIGGPFCFSALPSSDGNPAKRQWQVAVTSEGAQEEYWVFEYDDDGNPNMQPYTETTPDGVAIRSFSISPGAVNYGEGITLTWDIAGDFSDARIVWPKVHYQVPVSLLEIDSATGSVSTNSPALGDGRLSISYELKVTDNNGNEISAKVDLTLNCLYNYFVADSDAQNQSTCPKSHAEVFAAAYQRFEHGFMLWDTSGDYGNVILVMFDSGYSSWAVDDWAGEDIVFGETAPDGLLQPVRGFGKIWVENQQIQEQLGWAIAEEQAYNMSRQQATSPYTNGDSGAIYMALPDGRRIRVFPISHDWIYLD